MIKFARRTFVAWGSQHMAHEGMPWSSSCIGEGSPAAHVGKARTGHRDGISLMIRFLSLS